MLEQPTSRTYVSKSTPGWSHSSTTPLQKVTHSRNHSDNSRQVYPAPLKSQKVPMPAPLRTQKSKSPIPLSRLNEQAEAYRARNSTIPFSEIFNKPPKKQLSENNEDHAFLPATRYSPPPPIPSVPPEPSPTTRPRRPSGTPAGLVSWERIAIQNARIRATQGASPSPVSPLTQVRVVPMPRWPDFAQEGPPFKVGTPRQPEPPRRRGTPGAGRALRQGLSSPMSPLRSDTPSNPDDWKLPRRSGSGGGGAMRSRSGSGRSEKARKEVRWSKDVDYEG